MFISRIELLLAEKGIQKKTFLAELGLSKNSFVNWRDRGNVPSGATLQKIADYFGVSVDYLLGKTESAESAADADIEKNTVRFIGRDGKVLKKRLTPELIAYLESIPDSDDNL